MSTTDALVAAMANANGTAKETTRAARYALAQVRKYADYADVSLRAGQPDAALVHIESADEWMRKAAELATNAHRDNSAPLRLEPVCVSPFGCECRACKEPRPEPTPMTAEREAWAQTMLARGRR